MLYHAMVLLNVQEVEIADVMEVLRNRFGVSGVGGEGEEKHEIQVNRSFEEVKRETRTSYS